MVIVIHGAGGHGRVVADAAELMGHLVRFTDRKDGTHPKDSDFYITAIGDNHTRKTEQFVGAYRWNVIHPKAVVSDNTSLGNGIFVGAGAMVNAGARIGSGTIVNTGAIVEHDCCVGEWVHLAPGSILCGGVTIGEGTLIGAGAVVKQGVTVCDWSVVGCGAVVVKNITESGVYMGNPARQGELAGRGCSLVSPSEPPSRS